MGVLLLSGKKVKAKLGYIIVHSKA